MKWKWINYNWFKKMNYNKTNTKMYMGIITDIKAGLIDSVRFNLILGHIYSNIKYRESFYKLIKYNFLLHLLPVMILDIIGYLFQFSLHNILFYLNFPLNLFSIFIHLIIHMESVSNITLALSDSNKKTKNSTTITDLLTVTITMTIYQLVIYLSIRIVNLLLYDSLFLLRFAINFIILTIYHSMYSHNNLWQYRKINMIH